MFAAHSKRSMSRAIFLWMAIALVSIAGTWFVVITWWEIIERVATTADILFYLIMLPVGVLTFLGWLCRRLALQRKRAHPLPAQTPAALPDAPLSWTEDASLTTQDLPILAAWVMTAIGSEGNEFADKLAQRRHRPVPDEVLTDEQGFPPLTGRVTNIDTTPAARILMNLYPDRLPDEFGAGDMRDALLRALTLLESVLQQAAQEWPFDIVASTNPRTARSDSPTLRGTAGLPRNEETPLELHVKLLLSDALTPAERDIAQAFAEQRLLALGICGPSQPIDIVPATDDATALKLLDAFRLNASEGCIPQALLLLACDSALCPTVIGNWEVQERLFSPLRPNGLMPGEAAFAILCANMRTLKAAMASPICCLTGVSTAQRSDGIDRQTAHACLAGVIGDALAAASTAGDAVGTVVCDADHRAGITLESIEAMLSQMSRLDAIEDRFSVNETCGHLGAASLPGALAAAAHRASNAGHPVLVFNVSHASERAAALLLPADFDGSRLQAQSLLDA